MQDAESWLELTPAAALGLVEGVAPSLSYIADDPTNGVSGHLMGMATLLSLTADLLSLSDGELTDQQVLDFQREYLNGVVHALGCHLEDTTGVELDS